MTIPQISDYSSDQYDQLRWFVLTERSIYYRQLLRGLVLRYHQGRPQVSTADARTALQYILDEPLYAHLRKVISPQWLSYQFHALQRDGLASKPQFGHYQATPLALLLFGHSMHHLELAVEVHLSNTGNPPRRFVKRFPTTEAVDSLPSAPNDYFKE